MFHPHESPAHRCAVPMGNLKDLEHELLVHPPYSPNLASSVIHSFPNIRIFLAEKRFGTNGTKIAEIGFYSEHYTKKIIHF